MRWSRSWDDRLNFPLRCKMSHQLSWKPRESPARRCCSLWSWRLFWHLKFHNSYYWKSSLWLLQKTAFPLVNNRQVYARISRVCCLFVCHHAENGHIHKIMDVDCPLVITSKGETLFQTRPGKRNTWSTQCFALGLVFIYPSSWYEISCAGFVLEKIFRQHQLVQHLLPVGVHLPHGPGEIKWQMKMTDEDDYDCRWKI